MIRLDAIFLLNSALLGVGLAMDAFSVSIANGLNESKMRVSRMSAVAFVYAFFQFAMPMVGWICVHTIIGYFSRMQVFIPWIALLLLLYIGGKMIYETFCQTEECEQARANSLSFAVLLMQGIATSIDALSVGFTIAEYNLAAAVIASLIIAAVTFAISFIGLEIGKKAGKTILADKAGLVGGIILVLIGIEIFVRGVFFK